MRQRSEREETQAAAGEGVMVGVLTASASCALGAKSKDARHFRAAHLGELSLG